MHERDGLMIRVYAVARTVGDCFKLLNRPGADVAIEVLRSSLGEGSVASSEIMRFAKICHVDRAIRPYLDVLLHVTNPRHIDASAEDS